MAARPTDSPRRLTYLPSSVKSAAKASGSLSASASDHSASICRTCSSSVTSCYLVQPVCHGGLRVPRPELDSGQRGAVDQRLQLGPLNRRVHANQIPVLRKAAVRARDDVLLADQPGEVLDPPRDQLRVLDDVGGLRDQSGDDDLAIGQLQVLP